MATQILRLPRTDKPREHLLVHVTQIRSNSLDLKLVGTEQEHLYHATTKESSVKSSQASNYTGDLNEWKAILKYAFLHERPASASATAIDGLEMVAAISSDTLTITVRKNIGGITQRLGSIKLDQDDEREEVSAFEWADTAVSAADDLRNQLESLQASVSGQQCEVANLTKQLDDLVKAKKEHEDELLTKFAALLNAKKLKIRDQQRLLNAAKIDPAAAEETRAARGGGRGHGRTAKASGRGKRKVDDVESVADEEMEDGRLPEAVEDYEEERREEETPPHSEADDDATEDEDDLDAPAPVRLGKAKANERMDIEVDRELPPKRDLPFRRRSQQSNAADDDDDDDETDDEL
ncbi:uncharacterized protein LTR77_002783 [Saxophila tyrrhenica]|uniref:XRCC4 coiled-coil domain-containing protein n=1 Tax=Saxophila tyrrhenica TaxID=1690608 RepID=A0AAV9PH98_9PEZI|nr:hypothetical protein LTR77_002783 [Saxophila tyrrhenica]